MMTHEDIRQNARVATVGLLPVERVALGVAIIETIRQTGEFALISQAGRRVAEHGVELCRANMAGITYLPAQKYPTEAITHDTESREEEPPRQSRARVALAWVKRVSDAIQDSVVGDAIGVVALMGVLFLGIFWGFLS